MSKNGFIKYTMGILLAFSMFVFSFCEEDNSENFSASFTYEFVDENHVKFTNESEGEYYSMVWDFGNDEADTTADKSKSYTIYYPVKGSYEVSLEVMNYTGEVKVSSKTVEIASSDFVIDFDALVDTDNPNYVDLTNTTTGDYDSFTWIYRSREVDNQSEYRAYFPFSGNYKVELQVVKDGNTYSLKKNVMILQDDPDYFDNLTLAWSDEFEGTAINSASWTFETGATGWGNNELQNYTDGDNAEIINGNLVITARKLDDNKEVGSYTSSRIISEDKREFKYGRIEIRANLPEGTGIWPAIWMLGSNFRSAGWPDCGEMDIMEYVGYEPNTVHATVHTLAGYGGGGDGSSKTLQTCEEEFHIYGLLWTEKELVFYTDSLDNKTYVYSPAVKTTENWPFDQPAFFILNIAVGGNWGGAQGIDNTIFPQTMEIDYVRVYQETH